MGVKLDAIEKIAAPVYLTRARGRKDMQAVTKALL